MKSIIIKQLPRVEGVLRVALVKNEYVEKILLESGQSTHLEKRLVGKYPLEAIQETQLLSAKSGTAHAIAATAALENYLGLEPSRAGLQIRETLLQLSTIHSHILHFYWELLPDYLNSDHYDHFSVEQIGFYMGSSKMDKSPGDLPTKAGVKILNGLPRVIEALDILQKSIALIAGKFPVVMNIIPGGISNFSINRALRMKIIRKLEKIKPFIETTWPEDIKIFIKELPETVKALDKNTDMLSFGFSSTNKNVVQSAHYSDGVMIKGKLEPINELKITDSIANTFYLPMGRNNKFRAYTYDMRKVGAYTWIKGVRYNGFTVLTGALSRILITYSAGGNWEISDNIGQAFNDLGLGDQLSNCVAARILAEVIESRFFLKIVIKNLLEWEGNSLNNRGVKFDFSPEGAGVGKVESPAGSLFHQVYINDNRITHYRIISATNWNFSPVDNQGNSGAVERELNKLNYGGKLTPLQVQRILHSYNSQIMDGVH